MYVWQVHQRIECQPVDSAVASDSDMNDVADSSDVLHYVSNSSQLAAGDSQLITGTAEPIASSSGYKVFVNGNPGEYVGKAVNDVVCGPSEVK